MAENSINPFEVTKAVDFTNQEIHDYWVDLFDSDQSLSTILKPNSSMPVIIKGGKGSGKTHLMRRYSFGIQRLKYSETLLDGIQKDGFIGIYFICSGLNSSRFSGKKISPEVWTAIFSYYMELWFSQNLLNTIFEAITTSKSFPENETTLCARILDLFDIKPTDEINSLVEVLAHLKNCQRLVDIAVNNAPLVGSINVRVGLTRGSLIFGLPKILGEFFVELKDITFLYLVDEFENLTLEQQVYINTLLREKVAPTSFRIGSRLYGIRTTKTLSANEDNREGSEYESFHLDDSLRASDRYDSFAKRLIKKRLKEAGYLPKLADPDFDSEIATSFENSSPEEEVIARVLKNGGAERPHIRNLRQKLQIGLKNGVAPGVKSEKDIEEIINLISAPSKPLLEKVNTFVLYKKWSEQLNLMEQASLLSVAKQNFIQGIQESSIYNSAFSHFRHDLIAQINREHKWPQKYTGIETLIQMSQGLPRNLLVMLKHIYKWAFFNGEKPFCGNPITLKSQSQGVLDASEWFFRDAQIAGADGLEVQRSINMLAELFKEIRFSDKPSECSLCSFSTDLNKCSEMASKAIKKAENLSLLISMKGGGKEKNSKKTSEKYQINSMLSPRWDLPIHRRGVIELSKEEANAIFDPKYFSEFEFIKKERLKGMTAPYFGRSKPSDSTIDKGPQTSFLGD